MPFPQPIFAKQSSARREQSKKISSAGRKSCLVREYCLLGEQRGQPSAFYIGSFYFVQSDFGNNSFVQQSDNVTFCCGRAYSEFYLQVFHRDQGCLIFCEHLDYLGLTLIKISRTQIDARSFFFVEEPAEFTYEPWNFLVGRWDVDDLVSDAILHYHFVVASEASGIVRVLHRFVCHQAMYLQQQIFGQGHIFVIYSELPLS